MVSSLLDTGAEVEQVCSQKLSPQDEEVRTLQDPDTPGLSVTVRIEQEFRIFEQNLEEVAPLEISSACLPWRMIYWSVKDKWEGAVHERFALEADCCELCQIVFHHASKFPNEDTNEPMEVVWHDDPDFHRFEVEAGEEWLISLCSPESSPCPWGIFPTKFVSLYESSPEFYGWPLFDKVSYLISHCLDSHSCGNVDNIPHLPNRVIKIGNYAEDLHLFQSNGLQAQYMCLSHCWGSKRPLQTTRANISNHLGCLPWNDIPKCYQETIQLAHKLGITYVWIDSLCIIQDDVVDWAQESQLMCDVYENAYLTVYTTSSPDCSVGIQDMSHQIVQKFQGITSSGTGYTHLAFQMSPNTHPDPSNTIERQQIWPLLDRAWAFQERMLSPRVLHYKAGELMWECKEEAFCECGRMDPLGKEAGFSIAFETADKDLLAAAWQETVSWFSGLSLTYSADKLPALSGLARKFSQKQPGAKYLAGLWDHSLIPDLMWVNSASVDGDVEDLGKPLDNWRAPSWSWASIDGRVLLPMCSYYNPRQDRHRYFQIERIYACIISAKCTPATTDPTGRVKDGLLEIAGRLMFGFLWLGRDGDVFLSVGGLQDPFSGGTSHSERKLILDTLDRSCLEQENGFLPSQPVLCLPLARVRRYDYDRTISEEDDPIEADEVIQEAKRQEIDYAMVLMPTGQGDTPTYRRIGMAVQETTTGQADEISHYWAQHPSFVEIGLTEHTILIV